MPLNKKPKINVCVWYIVAVLLPFCLLFLIIVLTISGRRFLWKDRKFTEAFYGYETQWAFKGAIASGTMSIARHSACPSLVFIRCFSWPDMLEFNAAIWLVECRKIIVQLMRHAFKHTKMFAPPCTITTWKFFMVAVLVINWNTSQKLKTSPILCKVNEHFFGIPVHVTAFVDYASIFSSNLVRQKHQVLF